MLTTATITSGEDIVALTGLLGALAQDIQCEAASQRALRDCYGPPLRGHLQSLQLIGQDHAPLAPPCALLTRFATCTQQKTGTIMPTPDLRKAAESVYSTLRESLPRDREPALEAAMALYGLINKPDPDEESNHLPSPEQVRAGFHRLSPVLQAALTTQSRLLTEKKKGAKHLGADLDCSPCFLRATVIEWVTTLLQGPLGSQLILHRSGSGSSYRVAIQPAQQLAEALDWLCCTSLTYSHDFFKMLLREPWVKQQGGAPYVQEVIRFVNHLTGSTFLMSTTQCTSLAEEGHVIKRSLYNVKRLVADQQLLKKVEKVIPDAATRQAILKASSMPHWLFYSEKGFATGLVHAVATLTPFNKDGLTEPDVLSRLKCLGALFNLFLGKKPVLDSRSFFRPRLVNAGISYADQQKLVTAINTTCGTNHRLVFRRDVWLEGELPIVQLATRVSRPVQSCAPRSSPPTRAYRPMPEAPKTTPAHQTPAPPILPETPPSLQFEVGTCVVHPGIGVGRIIGMTEQALGENKVLLYVIQYEENSLGLTRGMVPAGSASKVRLRPLANEESVSAGLETLQRRRTRAPHGDWVVFRKDCEQLLQEGSLQSLAMLLSRLEAVRPHWVKIKDPFRLYDKALQMMANEIALIQSRRRSDVHSEITALLQRAA